MAGIEELREKREDLNRSVAQDEEEKGVPALSLERVALIPLGCEH